MVVLASADSAASLSMTSNPFGAECHGYRYGPVHLHRPRGVSAARLWYSSAICFQSVSAAVSVRIGGVAAPRVRPPDTADQE